MAFRPLQTRTFPAFGATASTPQQSTTLQSTALPGTISAPLQGGFDVSTIMPSMISMMMLMMFMKMMTGMMKNMTD